MNICPVSFCSNVIKFPKHLSENKTVQGVRPETKHGGDVFVKISGDKARGQGLKIKSLNDYNSELRELLKNLRSKKVSPEDSADRFAEVLKNKQLVRTFDSEIEKIGTVPEDELDTDPLERFYDLTFNIQSKLNDSLQNRTKMAFVTYLLQPFDSRYEEFCEKCEEVYGDCAEEGEEQKVLNLNALVDVDKPDASEKETKDVITEMTEYLRDIFANDPEPEFNLSIKIDEDYDENKFVNACKNLFSLVSMTRADSVEAEKK